MNTKSQSIEEIKVAPAALAELVGMVAGGEINQNTAKTVLGEMLESGKSAAGVVKEKSLRQVSDQAQIEAWVEQILAENPAQVESYLGGKETVAQWLFGQVMRLGRGQANPQVVQQTLQQRLQAIKQSRTR
jgi:aspartyl-tRNA(Asn)/glutamyl-tRNA(Gln) amidotransferase subunit B